MGSKDVLRCRVGRVISLGAENHVEMGVKVVVINLILLVVGWIV
jgi:hypothetical protein